MHHIAVALAGREAEALLLGPERVSTGAANDIEKAALLARRMVCEWGMLPLSDEVCFFSQQQKDQAASSGFRRGGCWRPARCARIRSRGSGSRAF